eukprot:7282361-Pyramimonas_sp.AAC.1
MKVRVVHLRRWAAEHTRPFFALGQGKCTVDVAARTMVHAEAADQLQGGAIVTALIDISKCFDRVIWMKILMAAKMHEFPVAILKMCMSMYAAPRRIRWADTYSFAVAVGQGVLPGCTAAMYLLQL